MQTNLKGAESWAVFASPDGQDEAARLASILRQRHGATEFILRCQRLCSQGRISPDQLTALRAQKEASDKGRQGAGA